MARVRRDVHTSRLAHSPLVVAQHRDPVPDHAPGKPLVGLNRLRARSVAEHHGGEWPAAWRKIDDVVQPDVTALEEPLLEIICHTQRAGARDRRGRKNKVQCGSADPRDA